MYLASNQDLYDYIKQLSHSLKDNGANDLSEMAIKASLQSSGMSTEFLGESMIALRRIREEGKAILDASQKVEIEEILQQLTAALNRSPQNKM